MSISVFNSSTIYVQALHTMTFPPSFSLVQSHRVLKEME